MMYMKEYFVKTSDEATAEYLRSHGFKELAKEDNRWVFINEQANLDFTEADVDLKMNFSNVLCV